MDVRQGFVDCVGRTPLIRLTKLSAETGCEILGKAEFMNPGGSVKDRAALYIIRDAERRGVLKPGGTVVEGTAGNTGIGFAHICAARGYRCVIVIPDTQSPDKLAILRTLGADVRPVPAAPYRDPNNYQKIAGRLADELDGAVWANQFDNVVNRQAHYETTGPEIWRDTAGTIDAFVCATGTGGTLAGVGMGLKAKDERVMIALSDPHGAALYDWYAHGELRSEGSSVAEGIGQGRITANLEGAPVDAQFRVSDAEGWDWVKRLLDEEGLCLGLSSGINVAGAVRLARQLGPGSRVATILCDTGFRYLSTLWNREWLETKGLPVPAWLARG